MGHLGKRRVCSESHGKERAGEENLLFIAFLSRVPGMPLKEPRGPQEIIDRTFDCEYEHGFSSWKPILQNSHLLNSGSSECVCVPWHIRTGCRLPTLYLPASEECSFPTRGVQFSCVLGGSLQALKSLPSILCGTFGHVITVGHN